jgi:hypothetical protein
MHRLNENSFTDLKFLIFGDSSTNYLANFLQLYCREILCHWDYWSFNEELIEWYKPDIHTRNKNRKISRKYGKGN